MNYNYFKISEFIIDPDMDAVPLHVADKIVEWHLLILNPMRHALGSPLIISQHSGYRSIEWEHERGRSGDSQHTFSFRGACDLTCSPEKMPLLLNLLIESDYPRVCWYEKDHFFHCDWKYPDRDKRFFTDTGNGWEYQPNVR